MTDRRRRRGALLPLLLAAACAGAASLSLGGVAAPATAPAAASPAYSRLVRPGPDGKLLYSAYSDRGDRIPDFSHCGYGGGGVPIPNVPVRVRLAPKAGAGDDRTRLQAALDEMAGRPRDTNGFRGAVLLARGRYRVSDTLRIGASGIVLRGEGDGINGTVLIATGRKDHPLLSVRGASGPRAVHRNARRIADAYVPIGATTLSVAGGHGFKVGDAVFVRRHGNAAWIREIGMDRITPRSSDPASTKQWKPFALDFDRVVTSVDGDRLTLDAPITCAIDARWGGGEVVPIKDAGRIEQVGVENLRAVSEFDRTRTARGKDGKPYHSDEAHAGYLVAFGNVKNAWARRVATAHFAHGVATFGAGARGITVEDASAVDPVSAITGGRRYPYHIAAGQLILVRRCYARDARHAFAVGARVPGPNVFLDCRSERDHATSEPHHRWSVGGLYDNVRAPVAIQDRQWMGTGHGWAGANYVVWNGEGSLICQQPPTAQPSFARPSPDGGSE